MAGRINLECQCSEAVQREHYKAIGAIKLNDLFDHARATAATQWLQDFLAEGRGLNSAGATFTEREVEDSLKKLRQCACGIDGLRKKYIFPILSYSVVWFHSQPPYRRSTPGASGSIMETLRN